MTDNDQFNECMKNSFAETGVAPQYNTPAWKACQYVWETAYAAGVKAERERCARIAESDIQEHAITITEAQQETHNNCCRYIAAAIRRQG